MANFIQLQAQIQKLQKEAEALRKRELTETIANIKKAIVAFGLTAEDLGLVGKAPRKRGRKAGTTTAGTSHAKAGVKRRGRPAKATGIRTAIKKQPASGDRRSVVAPKYRDSASGATWTGRGKQPKWIVEALKSGKKLEDFKI